MPQELRKQNNKLKVKTLGKNNNTDKREKLPQHINKWKSYEKTASYISGMYVIFILVPYLLKQHLKEVINFSKWKPTHLLIQSLKASKKKKKTGKTYQQQKNANVEKI